jgi:type III pantothenate kinase
MLLLIDAGNTRIKWALARPDAPTGAWRDSGAVAHADIGTLAQAWTTGAGGEAITRVIIANVAGAAVGERLAALLPASATVDHFTSREQLAGLRNGYRQPTQLGSDRFAAAIGARALLPGKNLVVATCGTATTIDAVSFDGVFIGGMILPGLHLMAASLANNTAQLPMVADGAPLPSPFADNTQDAIRSGCLAAQAGAIGRACAAHGDALCLMSGGAAASVAAALTVPYRLVDNLVLAGLHVAAAVLHQP